MGVDYYNTVLFQGAGACLFYNNKDISEIIVNLQLDII